MAAVAAFLVGCFAYESPAMKGLGDGHVPALAVNLLFQERVLAQGLGVLLLPGLALLGQGLLDLALLGQSPQPLGLLGVQGRLLNSLEFVDLLFQRPEPLILVNGKEGSSAGLECASAAPTGGRAKSG